MLDLVGKLCHHSIRDISRRLGDKVYADTLGTDQLYDLLDLLHQHRRSAVEKKMCLIKEEDHLGLLGIADFRQDLEELGKQIQHKRRIQTGLVDQRLAVENVDIASAV